MKVAPRVTQHSNTPPNNISTTSASGFKDSALAMPGERPRPLYMWFALRPGSPHDPDIHDYAPSTVRIPDRTLPSLQEEWQTRTRPT